MFRKNLPIFVLFLVLLAFVYYSFQHGMSTGFSERRIQLLPNERYEPAKTLWDWLQLIVVPALLGLVAFLFQRATKDAEGKLALEVQRHNIVEAYFDRIAQILESDEWKHEMIGLARYRERGTVHRLAKARTFAVLAALQRKPSDANRCGQVIAFLAEAGLINQTTTQLDLYGADLRGASLSGVNLSGTNLKGVDLRGADLEWANLRDIVENQNVTEGPHYGRTMLHVTQLDKKWADVCRILNKSGGGKNFKGHKLSKAYLEKADLSNADLRGTDLRGSILTEANLRGADLRGTNLRKALLDGADLKGARVGFFTRLDPKWRLAWKTSSWPLHQYRGRNRLLKQLRKADLSHARLEIAWLSNAAFDETDLTATDLKYALLDDAVFKNGLRLFSTDFELAYLQRAVLDGCWLFDVNMTSAHLEGTRFRKATLFFCSLPNAELQNADLTQAYVTNSNLTLANLEAANLQETKLEEVNLTGAKLAGANLKGARLTKCVLRDAEILPEQLNSVASLEGTILPDGSVHA